VEAFHHAMGSGLARRYEMMDSLRCISVKGIY